jgi:NAD(P)H-dependent FMN reductase
MYTIIAGTSRAESNSLQVAKIYSNVLLKRGIESSIYSLEGLDLNSRSTSMIAFENEVLIPSTKFIFVLPEYNGSYPGLFKALIDLSDIKRCWPGKKALLVGVATGRGGNIRGLDHITGVLNYIKVMVHPNKLPLSAVDKLLLADGEITDLRTTASIEEQVSEFINC